MTIDTNELLSSIRESLSRISYVKPETMPNIDLYMDQVTTFMEEALIGTKRSDEDKILTKTMINNYAKNNLLPPPEKKKYSKEHLLTLFFIYYFKSIISIGDLEKLLKPITDKHFKATDSHNMEWIYSEVFQLEEGAVAELLKDISKKYERSLQTFSDAPDEERDDLRLFSFICMLSYDVFIKKLLIEKIIDDFNKQPVSEKDSKKK